MREENGEAVKNIIDKINAGLNGATVSKNENGSLEFQFEAPLPKTGLVFEESEDAEAPDADEENVLLASDENNISDKSSEAEEFVIPEVGVFDEAEQKPVYEESVDVSKSPEEKTRGAYDEEFEIPDVFDIAMASEQNPADAYVSKIWRSYVPRFTEVTDDPYHFSKIKEKNKVEPAEKAPEPEKISVSKTQSQVTVTVRERGSAETDINDPTAEFDHAVPAAVVVNINGKKTTSKDTINVFKFSGEKRGSDDSESISDEELERREISGLTGHVWQENDQPVLENAEEEPQIEEKRTEEGYAPIYGQYEEELHESSRPKLEIYEPEVIPEGYEAKDSRSQANDTSEYNSFSMRDSFKDKFLDSIMAVRIRLTVAALLGIATLVFDIFESAICEYFGLLSNFGAPAIIDASLVASLFLLALPETCRALKQLFSGVVTPELSAAISGIAIFAYAVAMATIAPVDGAYPLFASVYAIMAINSIFATHCLHYANFSAFKLVSEKGNKSIVDKPLTRTLELENMALDGAVDESKSRCARVFSTPFVTGFYSNSSKNAEKTRNNLIILAIGFGVALVSSVAMFFIKGPVSALATFALVVSLSMPAFTILSHKLPYARAEREAIADDSAVIGERALIDYAGVDVVTFEDTEVFGPDDVTLKSASDRRSDYLDTMKKMASLFAALGGPLRRVFESTLNKKYAPAADVVIEDDGAHGIVDGEVVMAGTAGYMKRHGVRIPTSGDIKAGSTRVIYAASEGEFFATFTVHYSFSEEFALLLSAMREHGIIPLVYTRDFNINNEFMRGLTGGSDVIRVMKKYTPVKEPEVYAKINSAMVTRGEKTSAIDLILISKRYARFQSYLGVTELSASAVGAALAVLIVLCNMTASIPAVILALWQLGWSAALAIMSRKTFRSGKRE